MVVLVTGGAGFIGSNFILDWYKNSNQNLSEHECNSTYISFLLLNRQKYSKIVEREDADSSTKKVKRAINVLVKRPGSRS